MLISNIPVKLQKPFAVSGTKNTIPVDSQIGTTPGAASLTDGFPPLTMTPLAAGGVPPYGADTNGILYWLSTIAQWSNVGGQYGYDSAYSTAIGGYPKGAMLQKASGLGFWISTVDNNTSDPDSGGANWADFVPDASTTKKGLIEIATATEAKALSSTLLAITPSTLAAVLADKGYAPMMTFAEIDALTADQGPIQCADMAGMLYTWQSSAYFEGYRSALCGEIPRNFAPSPRPWEISVTGGVWSTSDPKQKRVISLFQERGHVVSAAEWVKGLGAIVDLGGGDYKAPDLQDMFLRIAGTDRDTANARTVGMKQDDALQGHWHIARADNVAQGSTNYVGRNSGASNYTNMVNEPISDGVHGEPRISSETRGVSTAIAAVVLV